jgi:hypothetical protein
VGVVGSEKEVGQVRRAGATKGRDFVFGWGLWWELRVGAPESGWAADRGWAWCWRRGGEKEVGAGAEAGAAEGRDFFLGGAGFAWWELRLHSGWAADGPGIGLVLVLA